MDAASWANSATAATTFPYRLQIVYGLLCNREGCPIAVEVFEGGATDPMTLASQVRKLKARDNWTPTRDASICSLLRTGVRLFGTAPPT